MSIDTMVQSFKQSTSGQLVSAAQHLEVESSEGCLLTYLVVDAGCQRGAASVLPIRAYPRCLSMWARLGFLKTRWLGLQDKCSEK